MENAASIQRGATGCSGRAAQQVTSDLLAAKLRPKFTILHIQWWGTCCEPGVLEESRDAGGARIRVQLLDKKGLSLIYVFDIFVRNFPYWGAAEGYPLRHWIIRDVYPDGQEPLYWRFVGITYVEHLEWKPTAEQPSVVIFLNDFSGWMIKPDPYLPYDTGGRNDL